LFQHRKDCSFDGGGAVVNDRDEGDFQINLVYRAFNNNILHDQHIHFRSQKTIQSFFR
jgi:hypothetical protein